MPKFDSLKVKLFIGKQIKKYEISFYLRLHAPDNELHIFGLVTKLGKGYAAVLIFCRMKNGREIFDC